MTRLGRRTAGKTQTEVLAVFLLLLLMGVSVFTLASSGVAAYQRSERARSVQGELRVAMSFLQMKVRQSDRAGGIYLAPNPVNGTTALVLAEDIEGVSYETWIYHDEGHVKEALILAGEPFDNTMAFDVAQVGELTLNTNALGTGLLIRAASEDENGRTYQAQTSLAIRSGGVR
jgi:Tfp pilus assembly protein PilW